MASFFTSLGLPYRCHNKMLEIACFNSSSAIAAAKAGADRIELCADYAAGGVTPTLDSLRQIRKETNLPVNVMIRPRAGDFTYTDTEFRHMREEIEQFKPEVNGFVFGILDDTNHVDLERNKELVALATPLPCTFHRAIDQAPDLSTATEQLIQCGFKSILTSGGEANAVAGVARVAELQKEFGQRISIIVGGGVRSANVETLKQQTNVEWYHSAAITEPGETADGNEVTELQHVLCSNNQIRA
jgi:copper homeostasis protein